MYDYNFTHFQQHFFLIVLLGLKMEIKLAYFKVQLGDELGL